LYTDGVNGGIKGDVEPGAPVFLARDGIEVLLDDLLSAGKSVAAAHREIMAEVAGGKRCRNEGRLTKAYRNSLVVEQNESVFDSSRVKDARPNRRSD
jgi:hypothetical protein